MSTIPSIKNVTVIGGGLMGNGIVQVRLASEYLNVFATKNRDGGSPTLCHADLSGGQVTAGAGYNVTMVDIKDEFLAKSQDTIQKNALRGYKKDLEKGTISQADANSQVDALMSRLSKTTVA